MKISEWRKQREAILDQIYALESGQKTHWDEDEKREMKLNTTEENIARLRTRLAELDGRFSDDANA